MFQFQHHNLIGRIRLQQRAGQVQRPLGANSPETAQVETVDINHPFGKMGQLHKALRLGRRLEIPPEKQGIPASARLINNPSGRSKGNVVTVKSMRFCRPKRKPDMPLRSSKCVP